MVSEMRYSGVMGGLIRLSPALNANAADLDHPEGAHLRPAKIVTDVERIAPQQATEFLQS